MKIAGVETFLTGPARDSVNGARSTPFLLVCLHSSDGLCGWGEAMTLDQRERGIEEIILSLARAAIAVLFDPLNLNRRQ